MADVKITDMTPGVALSGSELFEMVQSAATASVTATQIQTFAWLSPTVTTTAGVSALTVNGGTQTTSFPAITATQTWNAGGVTFTGWKLNVTSTASAAGSLLADFQTGGVSQFAVGKAGVVTQVGTTVYSAIGAGPVLKQGSNGRTGTFVCNGVTPVTVNNTSLTANDLILISLDTVGGTVGAIPAVQTRTASTGFTVAGTASDTSTYRYLLIATAA